MPNHRNQPLIRQVRRWRIALGMSAGAVAAAAVLGLSEAADAHADDSADVLGQAGMDLTQATQVLDGAPEAGLDAQQLVVLTRQESIPTGLPAADQADLTGADEQLTQAYQAVLTADQAFVAADQAGDLSSAQ